MVYQWETVGNSPSKRWKALNPHTPQLRVWVCHWSMQNSLKQLNIIIAIWTLLIVQTKSVQKNCALRKCMSKWMTLFFHDWHSCCQQLHSVWTSSCRAPWQWSTQAPSNVCNCRVSRRTCERSAWMNMDNLQCLRPQQENLGCLLMRICQSLLTLRGIVEFVVNTEGNKS